MALGGWPGMADFIRRARIPDPGEDDPRYSNYQMRRLDDPRSYQDSSSPLFTTPPPTLPTRRPGMPVAAPEITGRAARVLPPTPFANPEMANAPMPEFNPRISRSDEYYGARDAYLAGTPSRAKSILLGALRGGLQGLATGQGLGAGLGGAAAGAGFGAISPRGLRDAEFSERVKPRILERWALEDEDRGAVMSAEDRGLANEERRARIANLNRQNIPQTPRPRSPIRSDRGLYDPETQSILSGTEPLPKDPAPVYRETYTGRSFNIADPVQRAEYDRTRLGKLAAEGAR